MANFYELLDKVEDHNILVYNESVSLYEEKTTIEKKDIAAIAVSVAGIGVIVAKIIKEAKINKKIKNTPELASINKKIKDLSRDISNLWNKLWTKRSNLVKLKEEYEELEKYYKSMRLSTSSGTTISGNLGEDNASFTATKTSENLNPNFDPEKAKQYKAKQKEIDKITEEINSDIGELSDKFSELSSLNKDLRVLAKKYKAENKALAEKLESEVDDMSEYINTALSQIREKDYWLVRESSNENCEVGMKLAVYESWYNGEISPEERDELLAMM